MASVFGLPPSELLMYTPGFPPTFEPKAIDRLSGDQRGSCVVRTERRQLRRIRTICRTPKGRSCRMIRAANALAIVGVAGVVVETRGRDVSHRRFWACRFRQSGNTITSTLNCSYTRRPCGDGGVRDTLSANARRCSLAGVILAKEPTGLANGIDPGQNN